MKHLLIIAVICCASVSAMAQGKPAANEQLNWNTDFMKCHELSKTTHKPIFAFFTGSDWCGWCHKMQNDVFSKPAFIKWANKNVILLELDFPRHKQQPAELMQQNNGLQQAFQVAGFPTIWIFYSAQDETTKKVNITPLGSLGYPQGAEPGKEEVQFLNDANNILSKGKS